MVVSKPFERETQTKLPKVSWKTTKNYRLCFSNKKIVSEINLVSSSHFFSLIHRHPFLSSTTKNSPEFVSPLAPPKKNKHNWYIYGTSATRNFRCCGSASPMQRLPTALDHWMMDLYDIGRLRIWLVVSTHLKNISQIGSFPQVGMKKKIETTT